MPVRAMRAAAGFAARTSTTSRSLSNAIRKQKRSATWPSCRYATHPAAEHPVLPRIAEWSASMHGRYRSRSCRRGGGCTNRACEGGESKRVSPLARGLAAPLEQAFGPPRTRTWPGQHALALLPSLRNYRGPVCGTTSPGPPTRSMAQTIYPSPPTHGQLHRPPCRGRDGPAGAA